MKKKKAKIVYKEDTGETVYSMAALNGRTEEEQEEYNRKKKSRIEATRKERRAMVSAAFTVYTPMLLCIIGAFLLVGLVMYFFLK